MDYNFNNVYSLNCCDHSFFVDFDAAKYAQYDKDYHLIKLKKGEYAAAKFLVSPYYGTSACSCTKTSAPSRTKAG